SGEIEDAPPWTPPAAVVVPGADDFQCETPRAQDVPLRRLSQRQLTNTVADVVRRILGSEADAALEELDSALASLVPDQRVDAEQDGQLLFFRSDQSIGYGTVEAHLRLGLALGEVLVTPARLDAMNFACAIEGATDGACLDRFVRTLGALTHRRPLEESEFGFYRTHAYRAGDDIVLLDLRDLVVKLLVQPHFLFHVEGLGERSAWELASRLSYQFWDSMPDEALLAAAEDGSLLTPEGWQREVARLVDSERAEDAIRSFILEWFRFDQLFPASSGSGRDFEAIAGELPLDASFDRAVEEELVDLFLWNLRNGGSVRDFFLSDVTLTRDPVLASIYGVAPANGEPRALPPERSSILTRVGMLLARAQIALPALNSVTHPILRGAFIRRQITCDDLPDAPAGAMDDLPAVDRTAIGSRAATEVLTGSSACAGCHARINPAGYAFESFDPIGQWRSEERVFNPDGVELPAVALDTSVVSVEAPDGTTGGAELAVALWDSGKVGACFARHYLRFLIARAEDPSPAGDGCALQRLDDAIDDDRPLREVLALSATAESLRNRTLEGEAQ
ncbi:MAG: DUF1592 domain-containing protein, partial [Myxococcota bacterium]